MDLTGCDVVLRAFVIDRGIVVPADTVVQLLGASLSPDMWLYHVISVPLAISTEVVEAGDVIKVPFNQASDWIGRGPKDQQTTVPTGCERTLRAFADGDYRLVPVDTIVQLDRTLDGNVWYYTVVRLPENAPKNAVLIGTWIKLRPTDALVWIGR